MKEVMQSLVMLFGVLLSLAYFVAGIGLLVLFFVGIYVLMFESASIGLQYIGASIVLGWVLNLLAGVCMAIVGWAISDA